MGLEEQGYRGKISTCFIIFKYKKFYNQLVLILCLRRFILIIDLLCDNKYNLNEMLSCFTILPNLKLNSSFLPLLAALSFRYARK